MLRDEWNLSSQKTVNLAKRIVKLSRFAGASEGVSRAGAPAGEILSDPEACRRGVEGSGIGEAMSGAFLKSRIPRSG